MAYVICDHLQKIMVREINLLPKPWKPMLLNREPPFNDVTPFLGETNLPFDVKMIKWDHFNPGTSSWLESMNILGVGLPFLPAYLQPALLSEGSRITWSAYMGSRIMWRPDSRHRDSFHEIQWSSSTLHHPEDAGLIEQCNSSLKAQLRHQTGDDAFWVWCTIL